MRLPKAFKSEFNKQKSSCVTLFTPPFSSECHVLYERSLLTHIFLHILGHFKNHTVERVINGQRWIDFFGRKLNRQSVWIQFLPFTDLNKGIIWMAPYDSDCLSLSQTFFPYILVFAFITNSSRLTLTAPNVFYLRAKLFAEKCATHVQMPLLWNCQFIG